MKETHNFNALYEISSKNKIIHITKRNIFKKQQLLKQFVGIIETD